jgi:hypothetical protein
MDQNRICPACGAEYYPHVTKCADCGVVLVSPEEHKNAVAETKRTKEKAAGDAVKVMEGDLEWMSELRAVLLDSGIPCTLHSCGKGCCGSTCQLKVAPGDLEMARETLEEYLMVLEPDLRIAKAMFGQGKCPACGSSISPDARECADCGLPLIITGEED